MSLVNSEGGAAIQVNNRQRVAVVGVGNVLLKDEGIGVHVARALREAVGTDRADIDIIDGGTSPDVFLLVEEVDKLILIDAVKGGGNPGSIYRFHPDDIISEGKYPTSVHQIGLLDSLHIIEYSRSKPGSIVIIGIEPKEIDWGLELSTELSERLPQIVKVVMDEIDLSIKQKKGKR
ncbi:HyaD/HybD family hydrogenase maturation endopeptidase [Chloroflexota bacterium]